MWTIHSCPIIVWADCLVFRSRSSSSSKPSVFVLTSTNPQTKRQWTETCSDFDRIGLEVIPVLGLDGEKVPCMKIAWRRAQMTWALRGFPFIDKCLGMTPLSEQKDWFIIAEDSAKLFPTASIQAIQDRLRSVPPGTEILQTGYRRTVRQMEMKLLDLNTMQFVKEAKENKVMKIIGQKKSSPLAELSNYFYTGF